MWKDISSCPRGAPVLVCGGTWEGEINSKQPVTEPTKVQTDNGRTFSVCDGDAYASWVNGPLMWHPLPELPAGLPALAKEYDL